MNFRSSKRSLLILGPFPRHFERNVHSHMLGSSKQERPTPEAAAARKRLLEAFAQYDALAKRIRKLPCAPGSSQDRIQAAIIIRANNFLQKHMFPLQVRQEF